MLWRQKPGRTHCDYCSGPRRMANTMLVLVTRTVRSRTQILSIQDSLRGQQYQLKSASGFLCENGS